ncbi:unnamed protein product [Candida verbasci]|uniref:Rho-GAP domain-containing protein n=1 Tax=Candida verbasci TaxID=1227364 RepID=A0A9W4U011_9ASCO|nr:unnamed protein product [Candida verbasci]
MNNSYWSPDYKSGINNLQSQSFKSLNQLHEIRKLIFNYVSYYYSNSEYLNSSSINLYQPNSQFKQQQQPISKPTDSIANLNTAYSLYINQLSTESELLSTLASIIDKKILSDLTSFIKYHEPKIINNFKVLNEIYDEYILTYSKIEKLKNEYMEQLRMKEFAQSPKKEVVNDPETDYSEVEESEDEKESEEKVNFDFKFPLKLGTHNVDSISELKLIISELIDKIPVVTRKIPLPGYKNEIFSSDSFCDVVSKLRIKGMSISRSNLEKFGQSLLDLKFIVSTNVFSKKFKSENMWFEWSNLAEYVAEFEETKTPEESNQEVSSPQFKFVNDIQETTSRFNNIFKTVKSSLLRSNHDENLQNLEHNYNKEVLKLQELKYKLDNQILEVTKYLDHFEVKKIEVVYFCLTSLSDILSRNNHNQAIISQNFAASFKSIYENKQNYKNEYSSTIDKFSTGVYFSNKDFPQFSSKSVFQSLKFQFDMFVDFPLQLSNCQISDIQLLTQSSIPYFLFVMIKIIEKKEEDLRQGWLSPLNHQSNWRIKEKIYEIISNVKPETNEMTMIQKLCLDEVLGFLKSLNSFELVGFLKDWLLEISDSIIPFIVFDSLIKEEHDIVEKLASIPRSNLSSLLYLLEHIVKVFELENLDTYGVSDELPTIMDQDKSIEELNTINTQVKSNEETEEQIATEFKDMSIEETQETNTKTEEPTMTTPQNELKEEISARSKSDKAINKSRDNSIEEISEQLNSMNQIGAIPFMHLIMRPSIQKNSTGFKPPLNSYIKILANLLTYETRSKLFNCVLNQESKYKTKKESEIKFGLQVKKLPVPKINKEEKVKETPKTPTQEKNVNLISPRPLSSDFALRTFKTKVTPMPSPQNTSKHNVEKEGNRSRSSSSNFLKSNIIDVEFEK